MNRRIWNLKGCAMLFMTGILTSGVPVMAKTIACWNFEEAIEGQYGLETIEKSKDTVSGLIATPASGGPVYVRGADGKGHGTGSGILKVAGDDSLLTGFSEFNISFDVRLHAVPSATQAILRYGVSKTAWNIYTTTDSSLRVAGFDSNGTTGQEFNGFIDNVLVCNTAAVQ